MDFILNEIIYPLLLSIFLLFSAILVGFFIFKKIIKENFSLAFSISLSGLLGYATISYIIVVCSIFGIFPIWLFLIASILLFFFNKNVITFFITNLKAFLWNITKWKRIELLLLFIILVCFLFYITTALSPPFQCDELAYHIPEALKIVEEGIFSLGGQKDPCGNYPLLMESLFGLLFKLGGYTLIHLINYQIVLLSILGVYSIIKKRFSRTLALFLAILCFSLYEFLMNATSAYVDAATASFEVLAVLLFFECDIGEKEDNNKLIISGLLMGIALSIKFTALWSLLPLFLFFGYKLLKKKSKKDVFISVLYFSIPALILSCFWYIKTWAMAGHPLFPFMGHNNQIKEIVPTVDVLGEKTWWSSVKRVFMIPFQFAEPYYLISFISFLFVPVVFFIKKQRRWLLNLAFFIIAYFILWGLTTNFLTKRYLMVGLSLIFIFPLAFFYNFKEFFSKIANSKHIKLIFVIILLTLSSFFLFILFKNKDSHFLRVKHTEINYLLGYYTKQDFYNERGNLGGVYTITDFFNRNYKDTFIIMNWGGWQILLENGNQFFKIPDDYINSFWMDSWSNICLFLKENKLTFLAIDEYNKERDFEMVEEEYYDNLEKIDIVEKEIMQNSQLIVSENGVSIYKIDVSCDGK